MNSDAPHTYPRRLLLMVTGRTPQVVTETLYALGVERRPAFIPTEVHLITTAEGAQDARLALLAEPDGWFHQLCRDYSLTGIDFTPGHIHVIPGADGAPAEDIRSEAEHQACADLITETVRGFTAEADSALHVSLAGGRKTMTYYLGNALTLFGRPQDRLSHVLVAPPYESNREFFYPTPDSRPLFVDPLQRWFDAKEAQVTLADIPFVRLRDSLPGRFKTLESGSARFTEVVAAMQGALAPPAVVVDYGGGCLRPEGEPAVRMPPAELGFYGWLARRAGEGLPPLSIPSDGAPDAEYLRAFEREYRLAGARANIVERLRREGGMSKQFFEQRKHGVKEALEDRLGPKADRYAIQRLSAGTPALWGLAIAAQRIRFVEE